VRKLPNQQHLVQAGIAAEVMVRETSVSASGPRSRFGISTRTPTRCCGWG
jgi:hypothetical protein